MAIYRLLQHSAFMPEDIAPIVAAYEDCLRILKLTNRSDPLTEIIAKAIFNIAQTGVRDPVQLRNLALEQIGTPRPNRPHVYPAPAWHRPPPRTGGRSETAMPRLPHTPSQ
jgi:hypothetical protein